MSSLCFTAGIHLRLRHGGPETKTEHLVSTTHLTFHRRIPLSREIEACSDSKQAGGYQQPMDADDWHRPSSIQLISKIVHRTARSGLCLKERALSLDRVRRRPVSAANVSLPYARAYAARAIRSAIARGNPAAVRPLASTFVPPRTADISEMMAFSSRSGSTVIDGSASSGTP
jgi:hypothetical protein